MTASLLFTSCATRHKTYTAPDPARVNAATRQVESDLVRARNLTREARKFVTDAQKNADAIDVRSNDLQGKAAVLLAAVPEANKPAALELIKGITDLQTQAGELSKNLAGAQAKNDELEKHQTKTDADVADWKLKQTEYFSKVDKLAGEATTEREARIAAELQLTKEKWIKVLWKIGGGFVVLLIIGGVILYFTGKLGVVLAKVGIKAAV